MSAADATPHRLVAVIGGHITESEVLLAPDQVGHLQSQLTAGTQSVVGVNAAIVSPYEITHSHPREGIKAWSVLFDLMMQIKQHPQDQASRSQSTPLSSFQLSATDLDVANANAAEKEPRETVGLSFVWLGSSPREPSQEWRFMVPATHAKKGLQWADEVLEWLERQEYAVDGIAWTHASDKQPHPLIQGAMNDLAEQAIVLDEANRPWADLLRTQIPMAIAQTRSLKAVAPELTDTPRRVRRRT